MPCRYEYGRYLLTQKEDYKDGIIAYERAKTKNARNDNAYIEMRVPGILLPIFDKYMDKTSSPYLFDFHQRMSTSDSFNANVNVGIRQICEKSLGLAHGKTYCVYTFRHTWATVAQNECGATLSDVGFAMNHSDKNRVTRTYVKIDFSPAWALNEKVINKIFLQKIKLHDIIMMRRIQSSLPDSHISNSLRVLCILEARFLLRLKMLDIIM